MDNMRTIFARIGIVKELFGFLWKRKLYWLMPMIFALVIFAIIIIVSQATGGGSIFVYTLW
jgi:hypothetical protein